MTRFDTRNFASLAIASVIALTSTFMVFGAGYIPAANAPITAISTVA